MTYTISKADGFDMNGTSFHDGYIKATYNQLVKAFGKPLYTDVNDYKVTCEWELKIEDEDGNQVGFTVYDWKEGISPLRNRDDYYEFHIGTHTPAGTKLVIKVLKDNFIESDIDVYYEDPYSVLQRMFGK